MPSEAPGDAAGDAVPMLSVRDLRKVYPLYRSPMEHLLDLYGLRHLARHAFAEHVALDRVSFDVRRGERVAIIGRNGAGKSTLLKIVSGVTPPTGGEVVSRATKMMLLQIGTGFHPDLTGRQNAQGFARLRGVPGHRVDEAVAETEAFAEIGEYFDQPFSTYSTGMQARVMFAAAISVEPDLLIIDEVLSVGDAYFAQKCVNRLEEICTRTGATLLLVTHNIYDAQRLCDRMIWIDGGRIRIDDACIPVMNAYEAAVRSQTEAARRAQRSDDTHDYLLGEIRRVEGAPKDAGPCHVAEIAFDGGKGLLRFPVASHGTVDHFEVIDDPEQGNWGGIVTVQGRFARAFERHGSLFHVLPFALSGRPAATVAAATSPEIRLTLRAPAGESLQVTLLDRESNPVADARIDVPAQDGWQEISAPMRDARGEQRLDRGERFGNRRIEIVDLALCDAAGTAVSRIGLGASLIVRLRYRVNDPELDECPLFLFTVVRSGINVTYLWTDHLRIVGRDAPEGSIEVHCDPLLLGRGEYNITATIYRDGYLSEPQQGAYFAVDDAIYDMRRRTHGIEVVGPEGGLNMTWDFTCQQPSRWTLNGGAAVAGRLTDYRHADA